MIAWITRILYITQILVAAVVSAALARYWNLGAMASIGLAVAMVVGLPLLIQALIVGISFTISRVAASVIPQEQYRGVWPLLGAYVLELRDCLNTFNQLMPFQVNWKLPAPQGHTQRPAVLMVHGFVCNRGLWAPLARWLNQRGYWTSAVSLEPVWGSIDAYLPMMHQAVDQALHEHDQVILIGHSMGGLVIRNFLRDCSDQQRARIAQVITLGTPHRGTVHARYGLGVNAAQMRRDSPWLQELSRAEIERGGLGVPASIVLSHHDNIVAPQAIQYPQAVKPADITQFAGIGHLTLAFHPGVWAHIESLLKRLPVSDPLRSEYPSSTAETPPDRH
jgi:predicted alpha/beta hydrolase family esterase